MQIQSSDIPHRPPDGPRYPQRPQVQQPMVYVYEKQMWEYKVVTKDVDEQSLSEEELNALGASGWELVGAVPSGGKVQFYFKRVRT